MSICPAPVFHGMCRDEFDWANWVGSVENRIHRFCGPSSLEDLVLLVKDATDGNHEIHALGSGWAFEDLATSSDWVVSLVGLTSQLTYVVDAALTDEWHTRHNDPNGPDRLFHVEAGAEIGAINETLAEQGLAMRTLGGANGQTLVGAFSTSTHGGDIALAPLPDQIRALHIVTVGGQELWVEPKSAPITQDDRLSAVLPCAGTRIIRSDEVFNAALVSAGRFGVIYSVVVQVRPAFKLAEWTTRQPTAGVLKCLTSGIDNGTGLAPLHALLPDPPEALGADIGEDPHFFQLLFNSQDPAVCLIQRRWPTTEDDLHATQAQSFLCHHGAANAMLLFAGLALHKAAFAWAAAPGLNVYFFPLLTGEAIALELRALDPHVTAGEALALCIGAAWRCHLGFLVPTLVQMAVDGQFAESEGGGRRGPSHLLTSGTRQTSQSDCYRGESIEVVFPATTNNYVRFLEKILAAAPGFHQAGYISVRYSAPSRALLSMHNWPTAMVLSIECASMKGLDGNAAWMSFVEAAAVDEGGRPHWGQINKLTGFQVSMLYGEKAVRWREALFTVSGASTLFSNAYTRQRGLEPAGILREITGKSGVGERGWVCGGPDARWEPVRTKDAIDQIESGAVVYFTNVNGQYASVHVVDDPSGRYLRTGGDETTANNLDNLPNC